MEYVLGIKDILNELTIFIVSPWSLVIWYSPPLVFILSRDN